MDTPRLDENYAPMRALLGARPELVTIATAGQVCDRLDQGGLLHAGPPLAGASPIGPMAGAIEGALRYEGRDPDSGTRIDLTPCNDVAFVGPVAGVISASMPVLVVHDPTYGVTTYAPLNEGLGAALRFGAHGEGVIERLQWIRDVLGPVLRDALHSHGPIDLRAMMAEALRRGDELHNRNKSATSAFVRELAADIAGAAGTATHEVFEFLRTNDHFFLNISIAAAKCMADAAALTGRGSVVTTMASNGHEFGIRLSGTGKQWFTTSAPKAKAKYFGAYNDADACPVLGDSFITEVVGLGGLAIAAAPAIAAFVGGKPSELAARNLAMYDITLEEHPDFVIPYMDFRGVPAGIDARRVVTTGTTPNLNAGIAHRDAGVGQVGAGVVAAPLECFETAVAALGQSAGPSAAPVGFAGLERRRL